MCRGVPVDTFVFPVQITRQQYLGDFQAAFDFSVPSWHTGRVTGNRTLHRIQLTGYHTLNGTTQVCHLLAC